MKHFFATLMACAYFSYCGAASSSTSSDPAMQKFVQSFLKSRRAQDRQNSELLREGTDPRYVAFVDSKRTDYDVIHKIAPLITLPNVLPHRWAYTSVGKHQLFACFAVGPQLKDVWDEKWKAVIQSGTASDIVQTIRADWELRLQGSDYTQFQQAGCKHAPYRLTTKDINGAVEQLAQKDTVVACFDASSEGVQIFVYNGKILTTHLICPSSGVFETRVDKVDLFRTDKVGMLRVDTEQIVAYFKLLNEDLRPRYRKKRFVCDDRVLADDQPPMQRELKKLCVGIQELSINTDSENESSDLV